MEENVIQIHVGITIKDYIWNSSTCSCENENCLASMMDDSVIMRDEVKKNPNILHFQWCCQYKELWYK